MGTQLVAGLSAVKMKMLLLFAMAAFAVAEPYYGGYYGGYGGYGGYGYRYGKRSADAEAAAEPYYGGYYGGYGGYGGYGHRYGKRSADAEAAAEPTMVDIMEDMEAMVDMDIDMARGVLMLGLLPNPTMVDIMEDMVAMEDTDMDGENKHQRH